MGNLEILAVLGTHDTGRRHKKLQKTKSRATWITQKPVVNPGAHEE